MNINVCVPVLRRYDMLRELLRSLAHSTVRPHVWVIDNGCRRDLLDEATAETDLTIIKHCAGRPMGVAESWNWFLENVPEERVITNDDILFGPESLAKLVSSPADIAWAEGCGFACFLIRDSCVAKLGKFDEAISPGYGYYEDEDYLQRLDGKGTRAPSAVAANVDCDVVHRRSSTLAAAAPRELKDHHRRFLVAQRNYMTKWGLGSL